MGVGLWGVITRLITRKIGHDEALSYENLIVQWLKFDEKKITVTYSIHTYGGIIKI